MTPIQEIFLQCQKSSRCETFLTQLKDLYKNMPHEDFTADFFKLLRFPLARHVQDNSVTRLLQLTTKFTLRLNNECCMDVTDEEEEVPIHPFLNDLFHFLLKVSKSSVYTTRLRALHLIRNILKGMNEISCEGSLLEELYLMAVERLKDSSSAVRAEAVLTASFLQDPFNDACPIIQDYLFLLRRDPHHNTRKNVSEVLAISRKTLPSLKDRLRDVHISVRKAALTRISEKVSVRCFTMKDRADILEICLRDPALKSTVKQKLIPAWMKSCDNDVSKFLKLFEIQETPEVLVKAMNTVFEMEDLRTLLRSLALDPERHVLPKERLTQENAFFWRCLCNYLKTVPNELALDMFDEVTPTISDFCTYFEDFIHDMEQADVEINIRHYAFLLKQLLLIASELDFSDIFGLNKLHDMVLNKLKSPNCLWETVEPLVTCFKSMQNDRMKFLKTLCEISFELSHPHMPIGEEADEGKIMVLRTSLQIIIEGLKFISMESMPSELTEVKSALIVPCLSFDNVDVKVAAVEALGLYCLLDVEEARECHFYLSYSINRDEEAVQAVALKAAFDILLYFGPAFFVGMPSENTNADAELFPSTPEEENLFLLFQDRLTPLLDSEFQELRTIAVEGIGKLMLSGRITSPPLFSKLFLMCYSPVYGEDLKLRQFLTSFLPTYAVSQFFSAKCLEDAFVLTLDTLFNAPKSNILSKIDAYTVGLAFIQLAHLVKAASVNKHGNTIHDTMALKLAHVIYDNPKARKVSILARLLANLELTHLNADAEELLSVLEEVSENIKDKIVLRAINKVMARVQVIISKKNEMEQQMNKSSAQPAEENQSQDNRVNISQPCNTSYTRPCLNQTEVTKSNANSQVDVPSSTNEVDNDKNANGEDADMPLVDSQVIVSTSSLNQNANGEDADMPLVDSQDIVSKSSLNQNANGEDTEMPLVDSQDIVPIPSPPPGIVIPESPNSSAVYSQETDGSDAIFASESQSSSSTF